MKTWTADPAHSRIGFVVKHLTIVEISGRFAEFTATAQSARDDFSDAVFHFSAKTASICTDVEARDNHLKSVDFLSAAAFPEVTFASTEVDGLRSGNGTLKGVLTMHGVSKPITLTISHSGTVTNPMNQKTTAGFSITGSLKRSDYDIGSQFPELVISDAITLNINIECSPEAK